MANTIDSKLGPRGAADPLEQFFPERALALKRLPGAGDNVHPDIFLAESEMDLELLEEREQNPAPTTAQFWPMVAAGLVAIGVSLLALAAVARLGYF